MNSDDRRLIVEGSADLYFIAELWRNQTGTDARKSFTIVQQDGKESMIRKLANPDGTIWKRKTMTHLGIVIDADEDAANTLYSVSNALNRSGHSGFPTTLTSTGLIHEIGDLRIGVWIMPENFGPGMAEDMFLAFLSDELESQRNFAEHTLDRLETDGLHRYNPDIQCSKALVHTVLAWQDEPGTAMGTAVLRKYVTLPIENIPFVDWLAQLFS